GLSYLYAHSPCHRNLRKHFTTSRCFSMSNQRCSSKPSRHFGLYSQLRVNKFHCPRLHSVVSFRRSPVFTSQSRLMSPPGTTCAPVQMRNFHSPIYFALQTIARRMSKTLPPRSAQDVSQSPIYSPCQWHIYSLQCL